ncbi:class I SAM-dependent methyltransferase [Ferruginibacter albus]|uniref:class I SAM-dependent methyltransferase n=1 Tax=Ferruginibacter albus TaxID=2875540 RepID=UPI001CC6F945|nr:class I SAM-dependent methyltransferase [Ferruginibacter albus]UAY52232.1 class I SAM-dependent methyltransferase [Ferruginibacter albus]
MSIQLQNPYNQKPLSKIDNGLTDAADNFFPYKNGAYRIVSNDNYTESFGYQWNKFSEAQIDKISNVDISRTRFFAETNWDKEELDSKNILEVGSGAGRFSQIILDYTKANLYSVDFSNAVEANYKNNGTNNRLHLFQASIYELPFAKAQFDKVFCIGVLQHTPDFERSVQSLIEMAKPGAEVVVDFYAINGWWTKLHIKYLFRPFTKKLSHEKLYKKIDSNIDWLIRTYQFFSRVGLGALVNRFLPICDIDGTLPKGLPYEQLRELCVLDTFDMFSPEYDNPQKISTVTDWFKKYGMESVWGGKIYYDNCWAAVVKGIKK